MAYVAKLHYGRNDESCGVIFQTRKAMFGYLADLSASALAEVREINVYRCADPYAEYSIENERLEVKGQNMHLIDQFPIKGTRVIVGTEARNV